MVDLWRRRWTKDELLARVGRLEQLAGVQLVEAGDGAERGVRLLLFRTGAGFDFEVGDEGQLWAEAEVVQAAVFGEQLTLTRRIEADLGGTSLRITDTNRDAGRLDARFRGELQHLAPGEQRHYQLEIGALLGGDAIEEFAVRTAALTTIALTGTSGGKT